MHRAGAAFRARSSHHQLCVAQRVAPLGPLGRILAQLLGPRLAFFSRQAGTPFEVTERGRLWRRRARLEKSTLLPLFDSRRGRRDVDDDCMHRAGAAFRARSSHHQLCVAQRVAPLGPLGRILAQLLGPRLAFFSRQAGTPFEVTERGRLWRRRARLEIGGRRVRAARVLAAPLGVLGDLNHPATRLHQVPRRGVGVLFVQKGKFLGKAPKRRRCPHMYV